MKSLLFDAAPPARLVLQTEFFPAVTHVEFVGPGAFSAVAVEAVLKIPNLQRLVMPGIALWGDTWAALVGEVGKRKGPQIEVEWKKVS